MAPIKYTTRNKSIRYGYGGSKTNKYRDRDAKKSIYKWNDKIGTMRHDFLLQKLNWNIWGAPKCGSGHKETVNDSLGWNAHLVYTGKCWDNTWTRCYLQTFSVHVTRVRLHFVAKFPCKSFFFPLFCSTVRVTCSCRRTRMWAHYSVFFFFRKWKCVVYSLEPTSNSRRATFPGSTLS